MNLKKIGIVSLILGVLAGGIILWIGIQHNPQGAFYSDPLTEKWDLSYCALIFLSWFLPVGSMAFILGLFCSWIGRRIKSTD